MTDERPSETRSDAAASARYLLCDSLILDRQGEAVRLNGEEVKLGQKAYRLLLTLMQRPGGLVTKDEIVGEVWDGRIVSESAITSTVRDLRSALGDDSQAPHLIQTVFGRGYRFIANVRASDELEGPAGQDRAAAPSATAKPVSAPASAQPRRAHAGLPLVALAALIVLLGGAGLFAVTGGLIGQRDGQSTQTGELPAIPEDRFSILVATLQNDTEAAVFSRGIFDALNFALAETSSAVAALPELEEDEFTLTAAQMQEVFWIERLPRSIIIERPGTREEVAAAEAQARNWLERTGADIVIWGEVVPSLRTYTLRMAAADRSGSGRYRFEELRFGEPLLEDVAPLVLGVALAEAERARFSSATIPGHVSAPLLGQLERQLRPLAFAPPDIFTARDVRAVRLAYTHIATNYGHLAGGLEPLERAAAALEPEVTQALRAEDPLAWADVQLALGRALLRLGKTSGESDDLLKGEEAARAAISVLSPEGEPDRWAQAHNALGAILQLQGRQERSRETLAEANAAFEQVATVWTRETNPLGWAAVQNNIGVVSETLGIPDDIAMLKAAAQAYRRTLLVKTRDVAPLDWATAQTNLGNVLLWQGLAGEPGAVEDAITAYEAALEVRTREADPVGWAALNNNLGEAYAALADGLDAGLLSKGLGHIREAIGAVSADTHPSAWAYYQTQRGSVAYTLANLTADLDLADEAKAGFEAALRHYEETGQSTQAVSRGLEKARALVSRLEAARPPPSE